MPTARPRSASSCTRSRRRRPAFRCSRSCCGRPARIAGSRLEILDHAGHVSNFERPAAFNHVAIAYTMLHATAMAYNDSATEAFAQRNLTEAIEVGQ